MTEPKNTTIDFDLPEYWDIPKNIDPVFALLVSLERAEGVLTSLRDGNDIDSLTMKAICCSVGLVRQSQELVHYWHDLEKAETAKRG